MFDNSERKRNRNRGQVGIGTLIVFIAMVLVAAIAAGVLINTAGFLQSKSEAAGQQSGQQVTNRLQVASATGTVVEDPDSGSSAQVLSKVNLTVSKAPGASNIDLENATVSWVESGGTFKLVNSSVDATGADGKFGIIAFKDADDSKPVLNSPDDRMVMHFDLGADDTVPGFKTANDPAGFGDEAGEGELITVKITTRSGATTTSRLVVPQSLSGTSAVNL